MFSQFEVPRYLEDKIPAMKESLKDAAPGYNIFQTVQCLCDYTRGKIKEQDILAVKQILSTAEMIYIRGNPLVKCAMENVFIYSFSSLLHCCERSAQRELQAIMPMSLYSAYVQQMVKSGI